MIKCMSAHPHPLTPSHPHTDTSQLLHHLLSHLSAGRRKPVKQSVFNLRTEDTSAKQYFQFYGYLSQQQNMMQVRASVCVCVGGVFLCVCVREGVCVCVRGSVPLCGVCVCSL